MSCCGKSRAQLFSAGTASRPTGADASSSRRYSVQFEYIGRTGLTAIGPISGNRYRFDRPGAVLVVDPRDRPGLASVPALRMV